MSEQVEVESSEAVLFLLERDSRSDPWQKSFFGEGFRLGALPNGSGGREDVGELEKTSVPWGLHLRPLCAGMGILGDTEGTTVGDEMVEQPLGMSTTSEKSSSEQEASVGGRVRCWYWEGVYSGEEKTVLVWFISAELAWCVSKDTIARYFCHAGTCLHRLFFELHICTVARTLDRLEEPQPLLDSSGSRW